VKTPRIKDRTKETERVKEKESETRLRYVNEIRK